ncbi:hypothetical protein [Staphylococcus hominis]|uniref:hypothetical protein n=1 Tax=Staphylococcus hominis TaxID=1290 RepID=UPI000A77D575|nr:hypothetical protein [Staphylococcus hominis]
MTSIVIEASIDRPIGAGLDLVVVTGILLLSEQKFFRGKSATDIVKDKANEKVSVIRNFVMLKSFKNLMSNSINNVKHFGTSISSIFS